VRSWSIRACTSSPALSSSHSVGRSQQTVIPSPCTCVFGVVGSATPRTWAQAAVKAVSSALPRIDTWPRNGHSRRVTPVSPDALTPLRASLRPISGLSRLSSDILPRSFLVVENGIRYFGLDNTAVRLRRAQDFAVALVPALDQRKGNGTPQRGTVVAGRHIAFHRHA